MTGKEAALAQIIALARTHDVRLEQIQAALGRPQIEANKRDPGTLTKVFTYLGGIFIFAGLSAFIGMNWDYLNTAARIIITLGPGLIAYIMAIVIAQRPEPGKNVTVLLTLSALLQPTGLFVTAYEFSTGTGSVPLAALIVFGTLALQYGLFFRRLHATAALFFCIYFGLSAFASLGELCGWPYEFSEFVCGGSLLALSYGIQRTPYNSICGFGYFVSGVLLLWLGFDLLHNSALELLYLALASFMLYLSTIVGSRSLLITATLAILSYISYFTGKNFLDSIGWPLCLIVLGGVFFGVGNLALRLNRKLKAAVS